MDVVLILKVWSLQNFNRKPKTFTDWAQWLMPVIPSLWAAKAGGFLWSMSWRPTWATWRNSISTKNTKISWTWWHLPSVLSTQESETQNRLNPGDGGGSEPRLPLHSSLDNRVRLSLKTKNKTKKCKYHVFLFLHSKNTEISCAWWLAPVVPATQEAEAGELVEPRRKRLQ